MSRPRFDRLDALRGLAIVWMALFHFAFDLNHFGLLEPAQNFYRDPLWTVQRAVIVTLFMSVAGLSLAAALDAAQPWPRFWRRWAPHGSRAGGPATRIVRAPASAHARRC